MCWVQQKKKSCFIFMVGGQTDKFINNRKQDLKRFRFFSMNETSLKVDRCMFVNEII